MQIEMKGIDKSFGTNQVLKDAGFVLGDGEVHALMGENGAGKSTLMKILTGVYTKDKGTVLVDGREVNYKNPQEAEKAGIVFIHQELNVLFDLTVEENLFMGKEIKKKFGFCDQKAMRKKAEEALGRLGVRIDPGEVMSNLSVGQQQMIEICKALMVDAKVIIMDEPTAALTQSETVVLFEVIQSLRKSGVSMVYISHRMEEIFEISDRITVMRDGEYVDTCMTAETSKAELIRMMVGRSLDEQYPTVEKEIGETVLEVQNLCTPALLKNISFQVRRGEILGLAGLVGAGRTETARAIFGADPISGGEVWIHGSQVRIRSPKDAISQGLALIPEDRKKHGVMLDMTIRDNISFIAVKQISKASVISTRKDRGMAKDFIERLQIKCPGMEQLTKNLSGGNQQKVVLAKSLAGKSEIIIFDEPTRGIDVGAKWEIYELMNRLAKEGMAVIMISSEMPELLGMSDRILVMHEGEITGELSKEDASQVRILELASGIKDVGGSLKT